ncbi:MAG: hypothetical protein K2X82_13130 [Gemmataceae bacterium]|nr:hypothetical protein [Gemmataceae bacterium]
MRLLGPLVLLALLAAAAGGQPPPPAWVTIKGRVVLPDGVPVPARKAVAVPANVPVCPKVPVLDESVIVDPKTRGVQNVVVWLRPNNPNPKAAFAANEVHPADANRKPKKAVVDQPCCLFEPHILTARVGDTVEVANNSAVVHNFFWVSANNGNFNVNIPAKGTHTFPMPLAAEAAPIPFKCTAHPWMGGYCRVFDHPYYAVTDDEGRFEIKDAPAGNYRIVYWHENVGFKGKAPGRLGEVIMIAAGKDGRMALDPTPFDVR